MSGLDIFLLLKTRAWPILDLADTDIGEGEKKSDINVSANIFLILDLQLIFTAYVANPLAVRAAALNFSAFHVP